MCASVFRRMANQIRCDTPAAREYRVLYLLINKELFRGSAGGIQVVCKTVNRTGNTPPAAYVRAHVL
jgi:hypothetical protein